MKDNEMEVLRCEYRKCYQGERALKEVVELTSKKISEFGATDRQFEELSKMVTIIKVRIRRGVISG